VQRGWRKVIRLELLGKPVVRNGQREVKLYAKAVALLAYLALEGRTSRRKIAELLWAGAPDALNNLSVTRGHILSELGQEALVSDLETLALGQDVWCDALEFVQNPTEENWGLYKGEFLQDLRFREWKRGLGEEFEEWVLERREWFISECQNRASQFAQTALERKDHNQAQIWLECATNTGTEPREDNARLLILLYGALGQTDKAVATYENLVFALQDALGETPSKATQEALVLARKQASEACLRLLETRQTSNKQYFIGRKAELNTLLSLQNGETAWVQGAAGMGKTALLKELARQTGWEYVPARSGLPYATLEPLIQSFDGGEYGILKQLRNLQGGFLFDDWENIDNESQDLIIRASELHYDCKILIASSTVSVFKVNCCVNLRDFSSSEINNELSELTDGIPSLVGAWLRGEPLEIALEKQVMNLQKDALEMYLLLSLLNEPDLLLVQKCLKFEKTKSELLFQKLILSGFLEYSGTVKAKLLAQKYLSINQNLKMKLAISIGININNSNAYLYFQIAKPIWNFKILDKVKSSYFEAANTLFIRGLSESALKILLELPDENWENVKILLAKIYDSLGMYKEALNEIKNIEEVSGFKSKLLWKTGKTNEAKKLAEKSLEINEESRAFAYNTFGLIALSEGKLIQAHENFSKSLVLWSKTENKDQWLSILENLAVVECQLGKSSIEAFENILEAVKDNEKRKVGILLNLGMMAEKKNEIDLAINTYVEAVDLAQTIGNNSISARGFNNLGVIFHNKKNQNLARNYYQKALFFAKKTNEELLMASILANLAELDDNIYALEECIYILKKFGHIEMAQKKQSILNRMTSSLI
jgi:DNA-binding SARP family transcriptional activator/tetratricopeptide (TPR) repeat protein